MSRYLLDTTALIDFSKRREPAFSLVHRFIRDGDESGVSPINVAEFYTGLAPRTYAEKEFDMLKAWTLRS